MQVLVSRTDAANAINHPGERKKPLKPLAAAAQVCVALDEARDACSLSRAQSVCIQCGCWCLCLSQDCIVSLLETASLQTLNPNEPPWLPVLLLLAHDGWLVLQVADEAEGYLSEADLGHMQGDELLQNR